MFDLRRETAAPLRIIDPDSGKFLRLFLSVDIHRVMKIGNRFRRRREKEFDIFSFSRGGGVVDVQFHSLRNRTAELDFQHVLIKTDCRLCRSLVIDFGGAAVFPIDAFRLVKHFKRSAPAVRRGIYLQIWNRMEQGSCQENQRQEMFCRDHFILP